MLNCAAIPESLIESELFGHERGAFSGAVARRIGALEAAGGGTLFLDEIGELPLASQAKLLRVLEDKKFERVGSNQTIALRARIIAATNRDIEQMVAQKLFRNDLYFRVSVVKLRVPSLRERAQDVPMLATRIFSDLAATSGRRIDGFAPDAMALLQEYPWPGGLRDSGLCRESRRGNTSRQQHLLHHVGLEGLAVLVHAMVHRAPCAIESASLNARSGDRTTPLTQGVSLGCRPPSPRRWATPQFERVAL